VKDSEAQDGPDASVEAGTHSLEVLRKMVAGVDQAQEAGFLAAGDQEHHRVALEVEAKAPDADLDGKAVAVTQLRIAGVVRFGKGVGTALGEDIVTSLELQSRESAVDGKVTAAARTAVVGNQVAGMEAVHMAAHMPEVD